MKKLIVVAFCLTVGCDSSNNGTNNGNSDAGDEIFSGTCTGDSCGNPDAAVGCGLNTCMIQGVTCGPVGDGCGGVLSAAPARRARPAAAAA